MDYFERLFEHAIINCSLANKDITYINIEDDFLKNLKHLNNHEINDIKKIFKKLFEDRDKFLKNKELVL
jgi:Ca2+-binding EF-hand superfamily protein